MRFPTCLPVAPVDMEARVGGSDGIPLDPSLETGRGEPGETETKIYVDARREEPGETDTKIPMDTRYEARARTRRRKDCKNIFSKGQKLQRRKM